MSTEDNTQVVFEPARELLMELSPIMELFHGSHDMTAQLVKESNIEGRSHSRDYWMTILECIKSTLETSAASKLVLLEELIACLRSSLAEVEIESNRHGQTETARHVPQQAEARIHCMALSRHADFGRVGCSVTIRG